MQLRFAALCAALPRQLSAFGGALPPCISSDDPMKPGEQGLTCGSPAWGDAGEYCGTAYDNADFRALEMCCVCGGGWRPLRITGTVSCEASPDTAVRALSAAGAHKDCGLCGGGTGCLQGCMSGDEPCTDFDSCNTGMSEADCDMSPLDTWCPAPAGCEIVENVKDGGFEETECDWAGLDMADRGGLPGGGHTQADCEQLCWQRGDLCQFMAFSSLGYCHVFKTCDGSGSHLAWKRFTKQCSAGGYSEQVDALYGFYSTTADGRPAYSRHDASGSDQSYLYFEPECNGQPAWLLGDQAEPPDLNADKDRDMQPDVCRALAGAYGRTEATVPLGPVCFHGWYWQCGEQVVSAELQVCDAANGCFAEQLLNSGTACGGGDAVVTDDGKGEDDKGEDGKGGYDGPPLAAQCLDYLGLDYCTTVAERGRCNDPHDLSGITLGALCQKACGWCWGGCSDAWPVYFCEGFEHLCTDPKHRANCQRACAKDSEHPCGGEGHCEDIMASACEEASRPCDGHMRHFCARTCGCEEAGGHEDGKGGGSYSYSSYSYSSSTFFSAAST